jgi:hypothetical protein
VAISCLKSRNTEVHKVVPRDHQVTLKLIKDQLDNNQKKNCQILQEDLGQRKILAKLVPQICMNEQKARSVTTGADVIQTCQINPHFLSCIITGNEFWNILPLKFPISKVQV